MRALESPTKRDLRELRTWLTRSEHGDSFLEGAERHNFLLPTDSDEDDRTSDLVTVSRDAGEKDFFSRWVSDEVLERFHRLVGHRHEVGILLGSPYVYVLTHV